MLSFRARNGSHCRDLLDCAAMIKIKRVYEAPSKQDGFRVLVDGLWPRALTKQKAKAGLWLKEIAPTAELRKAFGHDPARWDEFRQRYSRELDGKPELLAQIKELEREHGTVTLVFGAKDQERNNAVVLRERLARR